MAIKFIRVLLLVLCLAFACAFLCACNDVTSDNDANDHSTMKADSIKIEGDFEETIEVNTEFSDSGVICPNGYHVVTEGQVKTNRLGRYHLTYKVYSADGELVKELSRYVNVVDTTAPTYVETTDVTYYAGFSYGISDFITYEDNYDDSTVLETDFTTKTFTSPGNQRVTIRIKDSSDNETVFTKNINVVFDLDKIVRSVYQNQQSKITVSSPEGHGTSTTVRIDSTTSFGYWDSSESIHYIKSFDLSNGNRASIQISAIQYGKFNNASISFHVTDRSHPNVYSVGFANIDATQQYNNLTISRFTSTINNIPLDEAEMLRDCNDHLLDILNGFQSYMTGVLHLEVK